MQLSIFQHRPAAGVARPRRSQGAAAPSSSRLPLARQQAIRPDVSARAGGKLDEVSLFGGSTADLLGGGAATGKSGATAAATLETVELKSKLGLDYAPLRDHLKAGDFRQADDETRALLIKMAGPGAVGRGWVYFTEVKAIPTEDLQTVDALWRAASNGRFGYSVQKELFAASGRRWPRFFKTIDWTVGENNVYRKWPAEFIYGLDAPKGHLPLTNALRGTQLFEALLQHPAFDKAAAGGGGAKAPSIDERSAAAGANTLKF